MSAPRPGILIQNGSFVSPPEAWEGLNKYRLQIERTIASVGHLTTILDSRQFVATAFVVAEDVIIVPSFLMETNVSRPIIDLRFGDNPRAVNTFTATEVIGIDKAGGFALVRVSKLSKSGHPLPPPLPIAAQPNISPGRPVYIVGYPVAGYSNDPLIQVAFKGDPFAERLQPGYLLSVVPGEKQFLHDCFTLGGSSGSPVVDLETGNVIGLHLGVNRLDAEGPGLKTAIAVWMLADHSLMKAAGVKFQ